MSLNPSSLILNTQQREALDNALFGKSFCLVGAAGTGKTTVTQLICHNLLQASHVGVISDETKYLSKGKPAVLIVGFTNKSVNHIRKKLPEALKGNCITIHKLLEYRPVFKEVIVDDEVILRPVFEPNRNALNPLPHISTIIFEESSQIGLQLFGNVLLALRNPHRTQMIFLGDLHQLPPVRDKAILGMKLIDLPTVELTEVYRQALESPIIRLATAIRNNINPFPSLKDPIEETSPAGSSLIIRPWKERFGENGAMRALAGFLARSIDSGLYNPETDMILCPYNVNVGTLELNKAIANHLTKNRNEITHEVIARYQRSYWAVGDRVYVNRHDGVITRITRTMGYVGRPPRAATLTLDRNGHDPACTLPKQSAEDMLALELSLSTSSDEAKNKASHCLHIYVPDLDETLEIDTAGDINSLLLGYALTVHKAQGQEWEKVFFFLHRSHNKLLSRELFYTAITRAKEQLYIICEGDIHETSSIQKAINRTIVPGTTLEEKVAYFKSIADGLLPAGSASDDEA